MCSQFDLYARNLHSAALTAAATTNNGRRFRQSRFHSMVVFAFLATGIAAAENVIVLKDAFIQKYKNRATIDAQYVIDKAHKRPNAANKDGDIHVAGRAPEIGLATVAEVMNAAERPEAVTAIHAAEGTAEPTPVTGVWRIWPEHGGDTEHIQGTPLPPFDTTNPAHVFEIHPITKVANIDVKDTFHPVSGYTAKDAEQAFLVYERTRSRIVRMAGHKVKIETPMAGMNYVKFEMELSEKPLPVEDGKMAFMKVRNSEGHVLVQKRRAVFVKDTQPEVSVRDKTSGDCLVVLGIPRLSLALVDWRVKHAAAQPEVLTWGLPYEIVVVGVYDESCTDNE